MPQLWHRDTRFSVAGAIPAASCAFVSLIESLQHHPEPHTRRNHPAPCMLAGHFVILFGQFNWRHLPTGRRYSCSCQYLFAVNVILALSMRFVGPFLWISLIRG